ncbi:unnamed protein product [Rotaria sp. Silwood1]|nr:unnamed protein product [Rotaria sp. Silwood1]
MTQVPNCTYTEDYICGGSIPGYNGIHTKYECSVEPFSSVQLPSCENGNRNDTVYWFCDEYKRVPNDVLDPTTLVTTSSSSAPSTISGLTITIRNFSTTERITSGEQFDLSK